ncbi:hypothetical protein AUK10_02455 [Candidatus Gracilibacteria bacterium CG2_30_37_12]|nr:MAG: hypothetical protein AUK10_02455 [Candidatus Gracilibacteria bacterium CG2_30_37_12]
MGLASELAVYKETYDLLVSIFEFTRGMNREYKYTIGQEMKSETMAILREIYRANGSFEARLPHIRIAREHCETLRIFLRVTHDLHQIPLAPFVRLNQHIEMISRQLVGWEK